jgi:monoamine oxidase
VGHATRFTMSFRERWWQRASATSDPKALHEMSFLFTPYKMPPMWWTAHPEEEDYPTLTGWVGGPRAAALEGKTAEVLGAEACSLLAQTFGVDAQEVRNSLVATHTHDWAADRFALGAYSYVPVGAMDAPAKMAEREARTMYFAGEHTDVTGHWGTVHAAIRSGLRVAAQIVD